jgi:hypothetical protein
MDQGGSRVTDFLNATGISSQLIQGFTSGVTGSQLMTYFFLLIMIIMIALIFHLPLDLILIFTFPFLVTVYAFQGGTFTGIFIASLIMLGLLLAKYMSYLISNR